ncbi:MAG: acyltransferase [Burkholderiales bacterium]|nr:acyltransferase [Burkholderiales bacterium]
MQKSAELNSRYFRLDAMRGLAAFSVLIFHFQVNDIHAPVGYLAVDFFFLLSGFVIAKTYDKRLSTGMTFFNFLSLRLIRIYPLFFIGFLIGVIRRMGEYLVNRPSKLPLSEILHAAPFEVLMLPSTVANGLFVFNGPSWSLFFEMAINLIYAAILIKISNRSVKILMLAFGVLFLSQGFAAGSLDVGFQWRDFMGGVGRVGFSFLLGMTLSRMSIQKDAPNLRFLIPCALLLIILLAPSAEPYQLAYDAIFIFLGFPILLFIGAKFNPPKSFEKACEWLGNISYPIYAIHYPLMFLYLFAVKKTSLPAVLQLPLFIISVVSLAALLNKYFDVPMRNWLTQKRLQYQNNRIVSGVKN